MTSVGYVIDLFGVAWPAGMDLCPGCFQPVVGSTVVSPSEECSHDPLPWREVIGIQSGVPVGVGGGIVRPLLEEEAALLRGEAVELSPGEGYVRIPQGLDGEEGVPRRRRKSRTLE